MYEKQLTKYDTNFIYETNTIGRRIDLHSLRTVLKNKFYLDPLPALGEGASMTINRVEKKRKEEVSRS